MPHIQLYRQNGWWIAAFMDRDNAPEQAMVDLFGTHHLPTSFAAVVPDKDVLAEIRHLNPDAHVTIS